MFARLALLSAPLALIALVLALVIAPPAAAQRKPPPPPPTDITAVRTDVPGQVLVSWDAVPQATYYRIGYVNMETDYHFAKASCTGEWIEAFIYVDVNARNIPVRNGRAEYTLRRLSEGARHAFTVLTSDNFYNNRENVGADFAWPQNPRWEYLQGRSDLPPGVEIPTPDCSELPAAPQPTPSPTQSPTPESTPALSPTSSPTPTTTPQPTATVSPTPSPTRTTTPQPTATAAPTPTPTPQPQPQPPSKREIQAARQHMVELINQLRAEAGAPPVSLSPNTAAQSHAEDMRDTCFLSHWGRTASSPTCATARPADTTSTARTPLSKVPASPPYTSERPSTR